MLLDTCGTIVYLVDIMSKRLLTLLFGSVGLINFIFAQQRTGNNGPAFGFARPLNDPSTVDPDPFGRGFSSGSDSMPNLESLANMPLDFLGGTTVRPPDFSSNNAIRNTAPSDPPFNDGLFLNGNFLNEMMPGTEFQLPPGTTNDVLPPNSTIPASNFGGNQDGTPVGPELPDLHTVMSMTGPSAQASTDSTFNRPNRNANIIFPQALPHEQPLPALDASSSSVPGASSVIRDWLSITSDPANSPRNRSPVNGPSFPAGPPSNGLPTINNQRTSGNIVSNQNNMLTSQIDMWSHNSLFNNPNLGEPSDLFGNMNIPMDFPIEENVVQRRLTAQQGRPFNNVNGNRGHVNQPPQRRPMDVNVGPSITRPVLPPAPAFLPGFPAGVPQDPNRRMNTPDLFRIGGGLPRSGNQVNPTNRFSPMNEPILTNVFRNPSSSIQNPLVGTLQNQRRNNMLNFQPPQPSITSPLLPGIQPNFDSNLQRIQQQPQPMLNDLSTQQTAINSFAPLPRPLPPQSDQNRMIPGSTMMGRSINPQIRPMPVNNLVFPTMNNPFTSNLRIPSNVLPTNGQLNPLTRSIPVENGNAARFINGQRSLNRNAQLWSGIENRSRNFGEQATGFPNNPSGRRSTLPLGIPPQFRGNQRQPQSLPQGLPVSPQRRQTLRNLAPTQRPGFASPLPTLRFPSPSQLPMNRNRVPNPPTTVQRRQRQRELTGRTDLSDRRVIPNPRRPQFPRRQLPNRIRAELPLNQPTNTNPFGIRRISPPVAPVLPSDDLPFMGSGFFNPRVMMFSDVEVKPSSKKRIKPVSKQNATQNLLEKATMQGLKKIEFINTPVVKENRVF
uniref:Uncharacterized protein LOC111124495 isoform X4 n=1 Tax=Crassostrea virginica TaxID=6565 RepID=A0A8B8D658_CRAVI|nr:uncharacterized protein LOC111124495 isoform X4 [Crassostrea virginica]